MSGWEKARRILYCLWCIMGNPDKDSYRETVAGIRKSDHQVPGGSREKRIVMHASSLRWRRNLTAS